MFRDLFVCIDSLRYDEELDCTILQGWAFNPVTKNPVTITANVPIIYNTIYRKDVNQSIHIKRDISYGFFVILKGNYKNIDLKLTFKSGVIEETINQKQLEYSNYSTGIKKLIDWLRYYGLIKSSESPYDHPAEQIPREEPEDEFKYWMDNIEKTLFSPESDNKATFTFVVKAGGNLADTIDSVKENGEHEIIIVSDKPIESDYPVYVDTDIAAAYNQAINNAEGDFIIFAENSDLVSPHLVNEVKNVLDKEPETDFIYADSDQITDKGERYNLKFKPDFDDFSLSFYNYILHPIIVRKDLLKKIGGFRSDYLGFKNYDLILRAVEKAEKINHIPLILYHWNRDEEKILERDDFLRGLPIVNQRLEELPFRAELSDRDYIFDHHYYGKLPKVTIVLGCLEGFSDKKIKESVEHILFELNYPDYQILAVNCKPFECSGNVEFVKDEEAASLSELYNNAAARVYTEYIIFLKPGFEASEFLWLKELISIAEHPKVGIVGPKIFNRLFQYEEAGIFLDNLKAYYNAKNTNILNFDAHDEMRVSKEVFAVSPDCLLVKTKLFKELGGFDEDINPTLMGVDLSIRAREVGERTIAAMDTPVTFTDYRKQPKLDLTELIEIYGEDKFTDGSVNPNLRPGGTAVNFYREK